jgi:hypothetical protein
MSTLTTSPCANVVARLFAEADDSDARLDEQRPVLSPGEHARSMTSADDYQSLYEGLKDFHLAVSREDHCRVRYLVRCLDAAPCRGIA